MWLKQLCASGGDVMECNVFKKLILFKGAHKIDNKDYGEICVSCDKYR